MTDDKNDGDGIVIQGPWKPAKEVYSPKEGEVIQGPWKPLDKNHYSLTEGQALQGPWKSLKELEDIAAARESKEINEIKLLEDRLSARQDAYRSYRNKTAASAFLLLYGTLGLTDMLTDLSSTTYLIALPAGIAFTRYLTKQKRTLLREFEAYTQTQK